MEREKINKRMLDSRMCVSQEKQLLAVSVIKQMITSGDEVTVAELVERTKLSRSFFYKNKTVNDELARARKIQYGKALYAPKRNVIDKAMEARMKLLEEQLQKKNEEIYELRNENEKLKKIINAGNHAVYQKL